MAVGLLHQCGHNTVWNIQSWLDEGCGDGLIISPVHTPKEVVEAMGEEIRQRSIFDPQFYLPGSQKKKLHTYDFFPEVISGGFVTGDFSMHALRAAELCLAFQIEMGFRGVVIPTRYFGQMITDFCEKQNAYTVHPFLEVIAKEKPSAPVYLNVVLTSHMIKDEAYRTNILNWITSFPEIDGVYLIPDCERLNKQVDDADYLYDLLTMLRELKEVGLSVILGYQNTEGLLATLIDEIEITFGAFENTRIFSLDKFLETEEERRGPRARIYLRGLLNWVQLDQAKEIKARAPDVWEAIYRPTDYAEKALAAVVEPSFNNPNLYKHHFVCFAEQLAKLNDLDPPGRYERLRADITKALEHYARLEDEHIDLEKHGRGDFLVAWRDAIDRYLKGS